MLTDENKSPGLHGLAVRLVDIPFVSYNHRNAFCTNNWFETNEYILALTRKHALRSELIEMRTVDKTSRIEWSATLRQHAKACVLEEGVRFLVDNLRYKTR